MTRAARSSRRLALLALVISMAFTGITVGAGTAAARPEMIRPERLPPRPRPTRAPRPPRPTRRPGPHELPRATETAVPTATAEEATPAPQGTATATATLGAEPTATPPIGPQSCPGVPVPCPQRPACVTGNRLGQLYYKYPGSAPIITTRVSEMRLNAASNGIDPDHEVGSFALVDKDNITVLHMPRLDFVRSASGWIAENEHGYITLVPKSTGDGYNFQLQYNDPNFPPGYFSVVYQMCLSIGDDGVYEQIVCQPKSRDSFLCHNNGPTY